MTTTPDVFTFDHIELITHTRDEIASRSPVHFNMDNWFSVNVQAADDDDTREQLAGLRDAVDASSNLYMLLPRLGVDVLELCGTSACLCGYALLAGATVSAADVRDEIVQVARQLGMRIGFHRELNQHIKYTDWFFTPQWPTWATRAVNLLLTDLNVTVDDVDSDSDEPIVRRYRRASRAVVITVMDEIIRGERTNWWHPPADVDEFHSDVFDTFNLGVLPRVELA